METDTRGRVLNVHYTMAPSNRVVGLMTSTYNHLGAGLYTLLGMPSLRLLFHRDYSIHPLIGMRPDLPRSYLL